ncbi:hypothetical protein AGMMS50249_0780 [candidate division SR1 bacterium]|nr:hypothetical protein AGMMS50249_0780 [candidate division SR1 bacterium]
MQRLVLNLQNCYGIKSLEKELDFSDSKTFAIYAPNGIMKSSFAKTFQDFSDNIETHDLMFPTRATIREITQENGEGLNVEVFVIHPYKDDYKSDKITTLLLSDELKERYQTVYQNIAQKEQGLFEKLIELSGVSKSKIQEELLKSFPDINEVIDIILLIEGEVLDRNDPKYENIKYEEIFNDKALEFLQTHQYIIEQYINKYNELVENSQYLGKDFNHYRATNLGKSLDKLKFFRGGHKLSFHNKGNGTYDTDIMNVEEFNIKIQEEENLLYNDPTLKTTLRDLDRAIKNEQLEKLRDYLFDNREILPVLTNLAHLRKQLWIDYCKDNLTEYQELLEVIKNGQEEIQAILEDAQNQQQGRKNAIVEFNTRFSVPFQLKVDNVEDILTKGVEPNITFVFEDQDTGDRIEKGKDKLLEVLSQGEKRALYLLNIIFEINARRQQGTNTLFIIDDIADSFDYKNKYAIIEYLKDISEINNFYQIILTHNFDFFRTIQARFIDRYNCKMVIKTRDRILIEDVECLKPFEYFKKNLHINNTILIASIPFVRNLAEYSGYNDELNKLTSLLHIKNDTDNFTIQDLQRIFRIILKDKSNVVLQDPTKKIINLIFDLADQIIQDTTTTIKLENKIVLSIAIRLKAEKIMIQQINDQEFVESIIQNQTIELIKKYKELFSNEVENIKLLEKVNLMTPENIHLNSFMYEPILDMSDEYLKQLYNDLPTV